MTRYCQNGHPFWVPSKCPLKAIKLWVAVSPNTAGPHQRLLESESAQQPLVCILRQTVHCSFSYCHRVSPQELPVCAFRSAKPDALTEITVK